MLLLLLLEVVQAACRNCLLLWIPEGRSMQLDLGGACVIFVPNGLVKHTLKSAAAEIHHHQQQQIHHHQQQQQIHHHHQHIHP
jgi:predicted amidohydrolase